MKKMNTQTKKTKKNSANSGKCHSVSSSNLYWSTSIEENHKLGILKLSKLGIFFNSDFFRVSVVCFLLQLKTNINWD